MDKSPPKLHADLVGDVLKCHLYSREGDTKGVLLFLCSFASQKWPRKDQKTKKIQRENMHFESF